MTIHIIGTNPANGTIHVLSGGAWSEFQTPVPGGNLGTGIWGSPGGRIYTHNGLSGGGEKYLHYMSSAWVEVASPSVSGSNGPNTIHGSDDESYIYSAIKPAGLIHRCTSGVWSQVASGVNVSHIWCDPTGRYVWGTPGFNGGAYLWHSDDYGATWNNIYSQVESDIGITPGSIGCVWGFTASDVYVSTRYGTLSGGYILRYNGTWSIAATDTSYLLDDKGLWGTSGSDLVVLSRNISDDHKLSKRSGSSVVLKQALSGTLDEHGSIGQDGKHVFGLGSEVVAIFVNVAPEPDEERVWRSTDAGETWALMSTSFAGSLRDLTAWNNSTPPYVTDESPAVDSQYNHPDVQVSLSIADQDLDLVISSVRIYLNDTLAWVGAVRMPGVAGVATETDNGYRFGLTPVEVFELGEQTVRVVASDSDGNALDTTYSFWVGEAPSPSEEDELADRSVGIDLLLDSSHDVTTADYDLRLVAGVDEVVQHLLVRLRLFLSEWYLDTESGVPYYRDVLVSNPKTRVIEGILRQQILGDEDIEALESFELEIDRAARELNLDFRAVSKIGPVEVSEITI